MDTRKLFNNPLFSDIKVIIAGTSYHCHKVILGSHSEYFNAKFNSSVGNPHEDIVIEDPKFIHVLKFMYTYSLDTITMNDVEVLINYADMYLISTLRKALDRYISTLGNTFDGCLLTIKLSDYSPKVIHKSIIECSQRDKITEFISNLDDETFSRLLPWVSGKEYTGKYKATVTPRIIKWLENIKSIDINIFNNVLTNIWFKEDNDYKSLNELKITYSDFGILIDKAINILHEDVYYPHYIPLNLQWTVIKTVLEAIREKDEELYEALIVVNNKFKKGTFISYYYNLFRIIKNESEK